MRHSSTVKTPRLVQMPFLCDSGGSVPHNAVKRVTGQPRNSKLQVRSIDIEGRSSIQGFLRSS